MNHAKMQKWMNDRNIVLEKSFTHALSEYAKDYKKKISWVVCMKFIA